MKKILYLMTVAAGVLLTNACKDDDVLTGNPQMDFKVTHEDALFGDSLPFTIKASDVDVPLSTLKAQLFFGDEKVSETVIRTKISGEDYSGKIYVPYLKEIPNGKATLKYVLQNINFTISEKEVQLALARPDFPYLTLVAEDGKEYRMQRKSLYEYAVTERFPNEVKGYIVAPKVGEFGNEMTFGWGGKAIAEGLKTNITFSNSTAGKYAITFNTFSYEGSPFLNLEVDGVKFEVLDSESLSVDLSLKQGQKLNFSGVPDYDNWWIDPDFFKKGSDGALEFLPVNGSYRIIANMKHKTFFVEAMQGNEPATLKEDGTGAIWVIGQHVGKPSLSAKEVGWVTGNALCMAQHEPKKFQITWVAGRSLKANEVNFVFFQKKAWAPAFRSNVLTSNSDLVDIGAGKSVNGVDDGNIFLREGKSFTPGHKYKFVMDVTAGIDKAVLYVTDEGEQTIEIKEVSLGGTKMNSTDGESYTATLNLTQNQTISVEGISGLNEWWLDPDYVELQGNTLKFLPVDGSYRFTVNTAGKHISVCRMSGDTYATLGADGHGAIWLMGWGVGSPSLDKQFGWSPGAAYCLAEVSPKVYRFTCTAGPEKGSLAGDRVRADYVSCKFFHQNGWGGEFGNSNPLTVAPGSEAYIKNSGNVELADGVKLEIGETYVMTVDLTAGNDKGVISFVKK